VLQVDVIDTCDDDTAITATDVLMFWWGSGVVRCWWLESSSSSSVSTSGQQSPSRSGATRTWPWQLRSRLPNNIRMMTFIRRSTGSNSTPEVGYVVYSIIGILSIFSLRGYVLESLCLWAMQMTTPKC